MSVCILDTSVLCNIVDVPGRNQQRSETMERLQEHIQADSSLLLPLAAIYETGNHIAQCPGGGQVRRRVAGFFVAIVRDAFAEDATEKQIPWVPTPRVLSGELVDWLSEFPDFAMKEVSLADLTIIKVFERQCDLHRARRVFIWSYDSDLQGYERAPDMV